ncbi:MAG: hypothetical protein IJG13_17845 [Kiritimatiellae bacterium]|nr:hypothetical protein [Kiritimatiellia bacterium]
MEVRNIVIGLVAVAAFSPVFAADLGPVGPRANPDDQYRFFWYMNGTFYRQTVDAGFNMLINAHGSNWSRYSAEQRAASIDGRRRFLEMMDRDGVDHVEQVKASFCSGIQDDYAQLKKDGTKNTRSLDFNIPACREELHKVFTFTAEALTNLPAMVGVQTSSEVRDGSIPSWRPEYAAACRRDLGFDPPEEYTGSRAGGAAMRADFPVSRVVTPDYKPLKYYVWFWKKGDGWNDYQDMCTDVFREVLGKEVFSFYDPVVRVPPRWGSGGAKCRVGSQWYYEEPSPFGVSYVVSMQNAMARGTPGMRVMTMLQGIAGRMFCAPKGKKVENEPAWVADRPNATWITQPPDIVREALWMLFARKVDGIGVYAWNCFFDASLTGDEKNFGKQRGGYQFTNPETFEAVKDAFLRAGVPLGPLFKAVPERAPEVAMLESHASHLLGLGGSSQGRAPRYGDLAVAANLQPYVIYEEEIERDGIPPSVKVLLAPDCGALLRTTFKALSAFQKKGGVLASDANLVPVLLPDVMMPDYLLSTYDRQFNSVRDREMICKGVKQLRGDLAWAYEPYGDSDNPYIIVHVRTYRNADYVFAINDKREYGDYVGQWKMLAEKGLPNEGNVTVRRKAGAVYDLVAHKSVPFSNRDDRVEIPVSYTTTDGRILLVAPRQLAPLSISVAADGEVVVTSPDKDVMIPIEVACDGEKPRYGVVENGIWKRPYKTGANLRVRNLADGRIGHGRLE